CTNRSTRGLTAGNGSADAWNTSSTSGPAARCGGTYSLPARKYFGGTQYALHRERGTERRGRRVCDLAFAGQMGSGGAAAERYYTRGFAFASGRNPKLHQRYPQRRGRGDTQRIARRWRARSHGFRAGGDSEFRGRGSRDGFGDGDR